MNHGMTSEWAGMTSEWMNQVWSLYKRPHLIHSFRPHSGSFQTQEWLVESCLASEDQFKNFDFNGMSLEWMEWFYEVKEIRMEWPNDGRMREVFRIKGFALLQKYPSFHPHSSQFHHSGMMKLTGMKWNWLECPLNDIPPLSFVIRCHSRHVKMMKEWRNEGKWGCFRKWRKKVKPEKPLIPLSFCHSSIIQN